MEWNNNISDIKYFNSHNRKLEIAGALAFRKMVRAIMTNDAVYTYLIYFFLDEISDWQFIQEMKLVAKNGISEREFLSRYFAARIPGEECYEKLYEKIEEISAKP